MGTRTRRRAAPGLASTRAREKFAHYRRIASLREYVLVAQKACRIEVYHREGDRWVLTEHGPGAEVELGSIGASIAVDDVYRDPLAG